MVERLVQGDGFDRRGHEFRYQLASAFIDTGDTVLDAACGTGYGATFIHRAPTGLYYGIDRSTARGLEAPKFEGEFFLDGDLTVWQPDFEFDVFVSFETIEHLTDYTNLISIAKQARRWAIMSVPTVPTKHVNGFHLHDFEPGDLEELMVDNTWEHYQTVQQPSEFAEICVFQRRRG